MASFTDSVNCCEKNAGSSRKFLAKAQKKAFDTRNQRNCGAGFCKQFDI
jgi:hypothetical protein